MLINKHTRASLKIIPVLMAVALLAVASPAGALSLPRAVPVTTASLAPTALHANTTSILTINGTNLSGASVTTTSPELVTIGTVTQVSSTQLTAVVSVGSFTGASPTSANITVTSAITGGNAVSDSLGVDPDPTVTGTYYAAPNSTNLEVTVTGSYFDTTGVTVASDNPDFTAHVVSSSASSVALLVTTDASAVNGTSSNITLTNTDGSAVTFVLNGGAPVSKPTISLVPNILHSNTTSVLTINGGPFMSGGTISTTTPYVISFENPTLVSSSQITVTAVVAPITGTTSVSANVTITNPDSGTVSGTLTVEADPTTTGTYLVAPSSTNTELTISGTDFSSSGVTATSSSPAFSVVVVSSSANAVTLLVSTTAAAGASTNVTLTNPDGSKAVVLITAGTAAVAVSKPTVTLSPTALHAGVNATLTITGGPFVSGATVTTSSPELITVGSVDFVSTTELKVPVTIAAVTGTAVTNATVTVTNPDKGTGSATLAVEPDPSIPGTYSVPPSSTNYELTVTGTELSATGLTVTSSNPAFSVSLVSSTGSSVALLVTTTAAAAGATSTVTVTNSDGSKTTFTLHSTAAPTTTTTTTIPVKKAPTTLVLSFSAKATSLSAAQSARVVAYAKKLSAGASLTVRGYASTKAAAKALTTKVSALLSKNSLGSKIKVVLTVRKSKREISIT